MHNQSLSINENPLSEPSPTESSRTKEERFLPIILKIFALSSTSISPTLISLFMIASTPYPHPLNHISPILKGTIFSYWLASKAKQQINGKEVLKIPPLIKASQRITAAIWTLIASSFLYSNKLGEVTFNLLQRFFPSDTWPPPFTDIPSILNKLITTIGDISLDMWNMPKRDAELTAAFLAVSILLSLLATNIELRQQQK